MKFADRTFEGVEVKLDGHSYNNCIFRRCEIVFGGGMFEMVDCTFDTPHFRFESEAGRTVQFFKAMCTIPGGVDYFDAIFSERAQARGALFH